MNPSTIVRAANPVADTAFADAWGDAEGRATFERIIGAERVSQSRPHLLRHRALIGTSVAVAAGTAAVVVGIPGPGHEGGTPASAAWAAVPTRLDPHTAQQLGTRCANQLRQYFDSVNSVITAVGEQRGKVRAVLIVGRFDGRSRWGLCAPGLKESLASALPPPPGPSAPSSIQPPRSSRTTAPAIAAFHAGPARIAVGPVAADIKRVVIETTDALVVTASVGHGYCLAWWPSSADIRAVREYTASGGELHPANYPDTTPAVAPSTHR